MASHQRKSFNISRFFSGHETRPIITLLTDFGLQDGYVGTMKGVIAGVAPSALVIDITHYIPPQDVFAAAHVLMGSYKYFPKGTIHVVVVDPGVGSERRIIAMQTEQHMFIAPDNGVLSLIRKQEKPATIVEVKNTDFFLGEVSQTFHGRDIFAPVAAHLACGVALEEIGPPVRRLKSISIALPIRRSNGAVAGEILYIDRFGNLITNMRKDVLERASDIPLADRWVYVGKRRVKGVSASYAEKKTGDLVALFPSMDYLEIAVNQRNASQMLGVDRGGRVEVKPA